jgi:site-specific recombinase XerD
VKRHDIGKELGSLVARNRDGSFATQANRASILNQVAKTLQKAGFNDLAAVSLKPKHVDALLKAWSAQGLSVGTIKNRMAAVRWWAEKVGKQNCVPCTNAAAGVGRREYVGTETRAQTLTADQLAMLGHERLRLSLELQQAFGLRREECMKFMPSVAIQGDKLVLKGTWCKGGRPREIPILTDGQRELLARVAAVAGKGSMIPPETNYRKWLNVYEKATNTAGLHKLHGLRHRYAQVRFEALTGFKAPLAGGPGRDELTAAQKVQDFNARMIISAELGHGREEITAVYLGR